VRVSALDFGRRIVIGTPVTPKKLFASLAGSSFCVSHADPRDLDRAIEFVGDQEILLLDNGAFTHWRQGKGEIDRNKFWTWANAAQARSPQAVAVIPDVIEGSERANLEELSWALRGDEALAEFPERTMSIWHMNESLDQLVTMCRLMNFVGFGSCAEFDVQRKRADYLARIREASDVVDQVERDHGRRPWIHLMRGLGVFGQAFRFESADSTNVAVNHSRHKAEHGDDRARYLRDRVEAGILAEAGVIQHEKGVETVHATPSNWSAYPTLRPKL